MKRAAWFHANRRDDERFARAVDGFAPGPGDHGGPDPHGDRSGQDRAGEYHEFRSELAVVAALRRLGDSVSADEQARDRIAERLAERVADPARRTRPRPRPVSTLTAALAVLLSLTGLGLLLSGEALPGDPLYQLKQAREAAVLGLTFDEEADAFRRLEYAALRLDEVAALTERGATRARDYAAALDGFAEHAAEGTAKLTALATRSGGSQLAPLRTWAAEQAHRLGLLRPAVPAAVAADPAALLSRIERRATALSERMSCYQITSGVSDELGSLPATGTCAAPESVRDAQAAAPATPAVPTVPTPPAVPRQDRHGPAGTTDPHRHTDGDPTATPTVDETGLVTATEPGDGPAVTPIPARSVTPPPTVPAPIPTPTFPRLPDSPPPDPPLLTIPPVLPGLPEVTIG